MIRKLSQIPSQQVWRTLTCSSATSLALPRSLEWWHYASTKPFSSYSSPQSNFEELFFKPRNERERILEKEQRESWSKIKYVVPFFRMLGFQGKASKRGEAAQHLLQACKDAADRIEWTANGLVPNDWRSSQVLITTYIWLVHKRLLSIGNKDAKNLQIVLFDELWEDMKPRMRHMKTREMYINKQLKGIQQYSFEALAMYDAAMTFETEEEQIECLGAAIWKNVYQATEECNEHVILTLVHHLLAELKSIEEIPADAIMKGQLVFADPPEFTQCNNESTTTILPPKLRYIGGMHIGQVGEWRKAVDITGKAYYWNTYTRESSRTPDPHKEGKSLEGPSSNIERTAT